MDAKTWEVVEARAAALGIGGWRWEQAWIAASAGHAPAVTAYQRALAEGASRLAAAAVAGAVAAVEARDALTSDQYRTLVAPDAELAMSSTGPERDDRASG